MKDKPIHKLQRTLGTGSHKCGRSANDVRIWMFLQGAVRYQDHFPLSVQPGHYPFYSKHLKKLNQRFAKSMDAGYSEQKVSGLK